MKAVILAAGMASRLRPLTNDRPKCLLQVGSKCLLQRIVDALQNAQISEFVIVTGYLHEMIESFLCNKYPHLTFHFIHNNNYQTTNNIYSLWLSRPYVDGQEFLLLDSDILLDPELPRRMLTQQESALALNRHECGEEEMKVCVDNDFNITELSKTCSIADCIGESVGVEKMTAEYSSALFAELDIMMNKEHLENIFYERAFERLIPQGHTFKVVDTTDLFSIELDTVDDFNKANEMLPPHLF